MKIYQCKECGSYNVYAKPGGRRSGVYCADCDKFICWVEYEEVRELYNKKIEESCLDDTVAQKKILKRSGITTMRCSKCDCLLYNSCKPKVRSQFDLVNAKFCPKCGRMLR